jgi:hypothetical protein
MTILNLALDNDGYLYAGSHGNGVLRTTYTTSVKKSDVAIPNSISLFQNYPNPFNPVTKIPFRLVHKEHVKIEIYNLIGQNIKTLLNEEMSAGTHEITFNAQNLPSGIYFYRITVGDSYGKTDEFRSVKRMVLLR